MTSTPSARELAGRAASASGAALLALLLPKCPVCIAAYLAALGLSAGAAQSAAPVVRPMVIALAIGALSVFVVGV